MDYYHGWPDLFLAQGVISNSALKGMPGYAHVHARNLPVAIRWCGCSSPDNPVKIDLDYQQIEGK